MNSARTSPELSTIQKKNYTTQKADFSTQKDEITTQKSKYTTQKDEITTQKKVLDYLANNPKATRVEIANAFMTIHI